MCNNNNASDIDENNDDTNTNDINNNDTTYNNNNDNNDGDKNSNMSCLPKVASSVSILFSLQALSSSNYSRFRRATLIRSSINQLNQ